MLRQRARGYLSNRPHLPVTCVPGSVSWVRADSSPERLWWRENLIRVPDAAQPKGLIGPRLIVPSIFSRLVDGLRLGFRGRVVVRNGWVRSRAGWGGSPCYDLRLGELQIASQRPVSRLGRVGMPATSTLSTSPHSPAVPTRSYCRSRVGPTCPLYNTRAGRLDVRYLSWTSTGFRAASPPPWMS